MASLCLVSRRRLTSIACVACVVLAARCASAYTQIGCGAGAVPVILGSNDFNYDLDQPGNYASNENYQWTLVTNSNVQSLGFQYLNFNTELNYDYISLSGATSATLTGNLGNGGVTLNAGSMLFFSDPVWTVHWHSDINVTRAGLPGVSYVVPTCKSTTQPTQNGGYIGANQRYDAVLIGDGDIVYLTVSQPANTRMLITADVVASSVSNPDVDLYESSNYSMPEYFTSDYFDTAANITATLDDAGAAVAIPATSSSRNLYFGIKSYHGSNHVVVRANVAKTQAAVTLNVCVPGVTNIPSMYNYPKIRDTLLKSSLRLTQLTHGNYQVTNLAFRGVDAGAGAFCQGISNCEICMSTPSSTSDYCTIGQSSSGPGGVTRIAFYTCNAVWSTANETGESLVLGHELGHSRFGLLDEYAPWCATGNAFCGHAIMNGPANGSDRLCTGLNHCRDKQTYTGYLPGYNGTNCLINGQPVPIGSYAIPSPPGFDCSSNGSDWSLVQNAMGSAFYSYPQNPTSDSSQPWKYFYRNNRAAATVAVSAQ